MILPACTVVRCDTGESAMSVSQAAAIIGGGTMGADIAAPEILRAENNPSD